MRRFVIIVATLTIISAQNVVFWEPEIPVPGGDITIYYNTIEGALPDDTAPVYIHLGYNGWQDTDDYEMSYAPDVGNGWWRYIYSIPQDAETIDFVFTDLDGNWDNNGGMGLDWHISLSYYWSPFSPNPNDTVSIFLDNVDQGGHIAWTVDAGMGHELPIEEYWPNDSFVEDEYLFTPLIENGANSYTVELGSFLNGDQVINSIKFKVRWDDGSWDEGSNGQVMSYDIYLDYTPTEDDPYVFFISPTPDEGAEVSGPVSFSVVGSAEYVEFWVNGELIETDSSSPFQATWYPDENLFGETTGIIRAIGENGRVTYLFRNFYLLYSIVNEPVPDGTNDGVNIDGNTVIIALYAPYKDYVAIKGSWNSQFSDGELMKLSGDTLWWYQIELEDGAYTYQYNVEGEKNIADPWSKDVTWLDPSGQWESSDYAHAKTAFSVGNDEFVWTDENFVRPEQKDVIIYEMHIGDFNGDPLNTGIFQDVTEKIQEGYFNDLGINTIELMPVNEFQGDWSWGYNPSFYMAPESSYGTPEDLKELVNTAHAHGIAVLFDVVFNHLWGSAPLFQLYQPLDNWDVSNVETFETMFSESAFNQDISSWDVSSATTMKNMFRKSPFNQPIGSWNVANVTSFQSTFRDNKVFDQDLSGWGNKLGKVVTMREMFRGSSYNGDLSAWDMSKVESMWDMFKDAEFNNASIANWDLSSMDNMETMFGGKNCKFNQDISSWDVSNVVNMQNLFKENQVFNQDLSGWDVSNVKCNLDFDTDSPNWEDAHKPQFLVSKFDNNAFCSRPN